MMVKACLLTHTYDTVIRYSLFYDVLTRFKIFKGASTQNDNISASPMCGAYHIQLCVQSHFSVGLEK